MDGVFGMHVKICMIIMQFGKRGNMLHYFPKHKCRLRFWVNGKGEGRRMIGFNFKVCFYKNMLRSFV
jgi:hypothetical protein